MVSNSYAMMNHAGMLSVSSSSGGNNTGLVAAGTTAGAAASASASAASATPSSPHHHLLPPQQAYPHHQQLQQQQQQQQQPHHHPQSGLISMGQIDVGRLEATVQVFYTERKEEVRKEAERELQTLRDDPSAWRYVVPVFESPKAGQNTKFFALSVLEEVIKKRWKILPQDEREGIKNFLSSYVISLSNTQGVTQSLTGKVNNVLLSVVKHEWPGNWPTFIPDLISACSTSEGLCANVLYLLKMLSEDIFEFASGTMTKAKEVELKHTLAREFKQIFELCTAVIRSNASPPVILRAIEALTVFVGWVPLQYVFDSPVVSDLVKLFPDAKFRNAALMCLTEIVSQPAPNVFGPQFYDQTYFELYGSFMATLEQLVPPGTDLAVAYANAAMEDQSLIDLLAIFFTAFFKYHQNCLEAYGRPQFIKGLEYLLAITKVPDKSVFTTCLAFWRRFVASFFLRRGLRDLAVSRSKLQVQQQMMKDLQVVPSTPPREKPARPTMPQRNSQESRAAYAPVMEQLREIFVSRMAKPEEVIVVIDENGNAIRERMKKDEERQRYRLMRECMVYLTHLNHDSTEQLLRNKLREQATGTLNSNQLFTISWSIGSIAGAMHEVQEDRFIVSSVRDLLTLCETVRGRSNKAVVAASIMYVIGQYPRFLRAHWRFLKTVTQKLFEFMHEPHDGVQDMACQTLLKIARRCHRHFVSVNYPDSKPYIEYILDNMSSFVRDLEEYQRELIYEAVGVMINSVSDKQRKMRYVTSLMALPNRYWKQIMFKASTNQEILNDELTIQRINAILRINIAVASAVGGAFETQLNHLHNELVQVYRHHSQFLSHYIQTNGPEACSNKQAKLLRTVRKLALQLYTTFIESKTSSSKVILESFVPTLMEIVLVDYKTAIPEAREPEALSLFATIIAKLGHNSETHPRMVSMIPRIFEHVFEVTLRAITTNFEVYPEHRLAFYKLLKNTNDHCFGAIETLNDAQLQTFVDSVVWGFRHTERMIAETGMGVFLSMITKFANSTKCNMFFSRYILKLVQELFAVLTDTFHKPNFRLHAMTLQRLILISESSTLTVQLWDPASGQHFNNNAEFLHAHMIGLLQAAFRNVHPGDVKVFVDGLYATKREPPKFKQFMRDFIVQTKEFSVLDNQELYAEEKAEAERQELAEVPGMAAQE